MNIKALLYSYSLLLIPLTMNADNHDASEVSSPSCSDSLQFATGAKGSKQAMHNGYVYCINRRNEDWNEDWKQALRRQFVKISEFHQDNTVKEDLQSIYGLAFIPEDAVLNTWEALKTQLYANPALLNHSILEYVENTWIKSAVYPVKMWNVHQAVLTGGPRTNNYSEGNNNALSRAVGCSNPSGGLLAETLKRFNAEAELNIQQSITGLLYSYSLLLIPLTMNADNHDASEVSSPSCSDSLQFATGAKGSKQAMHNGYVYCINRRNEDWNEDWKQALRRQFVKISEFHQDNTVKEDLQSIYGLAFIPEDAVLNTWEALKTQLYANPALLNHSILEYVENTWIKSAVYPVKMWNVHQAVLTGGPRTNNYSEGNNNALSRAVGCSNPSGGLLAETLKRFNAEAELNIQQSITGLTVATKKRKKYLDLNERIIRAVQNYGRVSNIMFCKCISNLV